MMSNESLASPSATASSPLAYPYGDPGAVDTVKYFAAGVVSEPYSGSASELSSMITAESAAAIAQDPTQGGIGTTLAPGVPMAALRLVSIDPFGGGSVPSGATDNRISERPAWVLIFNGSPSAIRGSRNTSKARLAALRAAPCSFLAVVDANSGERLLFTQVCAPVP